MTIGIVNNDLSQAVKELKSSKNSVYLTKNEVINCNNISIDNKFIDTSSCDDDSTGFLLKNNLVFQAIFNNNTLQICSEVFDTEYRLADIRLCQSSPVTSDTPSTTVLDFPYNTVLKDGHLSGRSCRYFSALLSVHVCIPISSDASILVIEGSGDLYEQPPHSGFDMDRSISINIPRGAAAVWAKPIWRSRPVAADGSDLLYLHIVYTPIFLKRPALKIEPETMESLCRSSAMFSYLLGGNDFYPLLYSPSKKKVEHH